MKELAYAKINLGLDVLGRRGDGYHEVSMVMQSVSLADEVLLEDADALTVTTDCGELPGDESNLAWKAATAMAKHLGREPKVHIHLQKKIFMAAGLAGGSSDAAAVLRGLNTLWHAGLGRRELEEIAAGIGSDVPFCIIGGTAKAEGRGEKLTSLKDLPYLYIVLAKPRDIAVSTAWVYTAYDCVENVRHPRIEAISSAITKGEMLTLPALLGNVLEYVTIPAHPVIGRIKELMLDEGADASLMSGSGPTVFGLTDSGETARRILGRLKEIPGLETALTHTVKRRELL